MRQVPHYLIIGKGKVATHLQHYFSLLKISHTSWHRSLSYALLNESIERATHILLLISDHAIESFIAENLQASSAICIHFSGSLVTDKAQGAHPMMTFGHHLYDLDTYQSIPFVLDDDALPFDLLFPCLSNPHVRLSKTLKPKYHALCVLSGNFSCLLWQKFFNSLESEFNFPPAIAHHYLRQQTHNLMVQPESALTGPLVRQDHQTIADNIAALQGDSFQDVYKSFITCYENMKQE